MINDPWKVEQINDTGVLYVKNPWGLSAEQQQLTALEMYYLDDTGLNIEFDFSAVPFDPSKVQAYPQFFVGQKDDSLPMPEGYKVGSNPLETGLNVQQFINKKYNLKFNTAPKADGQCNIASEIFLYSQDVTAPSYKLPRWEIMVWLEVPTDPTITLGDFVLFQNEEIIVYGKNNNPTYMAMILKQGQRLSDQASDNQLVECNILWSQVLRMAMAISQSDNRLANIASTDKVFAIEGGVEIWSGASEIIFSDIQLEEGVEANKFVAFGDMSQTETIAPTPVNDSAAMSRSQYRVLEALVNNSRALEAALSNNTDLSDCTSTAISEDNDYPENGSIEWVIAVTEKVRTLSKLSQLAGMESQRMSLMLEKFNTENSF